MKLNLGAGGSPVPDFVNVDRVLLPGIQVVHDLDVVPWPFPDCSAVHITAKDVFEHVGDPIGFMTECHRVLEPGRRLWIRTPHITSLDAFTDPTHRRFPTEYTFDYWVPGTVYHREHNAAYGGVSFEKQRMVIKNGAIEVTLVKIPRVF